LLEIAGSLLNKNSLTWDVEDIETKTVVELIQMLPIKKEEFDDEVMTLLFGAYYFIQRKDRLKITKCPIKSKVIGANVLYPYVKPLLSKSFFEWTEEEIEPILQILAEANSIDSQLSDHESNRCWYSFMENFNRYLSLHHEALKKIDPIYVVFNVGPDGTLGAMPGAFAGYPPNINHPFLVPQNASTFVYQFVNIDQAEHFIGWMQRAIKGLRCWIFITGAPCLYY